MPEVPAGITETARRQLAVETLRSFGKLRLRVTGYSMLPSIFPGDILLINACRLSDARPGDIALFTRNGRLFAHRILSRQGSTLITRGDALPAPDLPVSAAELLGTVSQIQRGGRCIAPRLRLSLTGRITAGLVQRSARAAGLLHRLHNFQHRSQQAEP